MSGKVCKTIALPLVASAFFFSGCGGNPGRNANNLYPVIQNVGNGMTSAYAAQLQPPAFTDPQDSASFEPVTTPQFTGKTQQINSPFAVPAQNYEPDLAFVKISEFSTSFGSPKTGRAKNIAVAAKAIDEKVIYPGEVFSYNDATGPTTKKNGYSLARIFVKGKERKGYGGGVCQVSSTLYNAVTSANLEIVERHPHSKEVKYVEKEKDAAVSYGVIDFKFKNTKDYPIKINTNVDNTAEKVTVAIERA